VVKTKKINKNKGFIPLFFVNFVVQASKFKLFLIFALFVEKPLS